MTELGPFSDLPEAKRRREENPFLDLPDASEAVQQEQPEQLFVERFGIRPAVEAGLALGGSVIGGGLAGGATLGAGAIPGAIAGGALGAAAGRGVSNLLAETERQIRAGTLVSGIVDELESLIGGEADVPKNAAKQVKSMLEAGATDLAFGTGFHLLGRAVQGPLRFAGRVTGVNSPEVRQVIEDARNNDLGIGAIDLDKPFFTAAGKVAGVIPIIGGPLRRQTQGKAVRASRAIVDTLDEIAPAIDLPKLGVKFTEAGRATWKARRKIAGANYQRMVDFLGNVGLRQRAAGGTDAIVPTNTLRERAARLLAENDQLPRRVGKKEPTGILGPSGQPLTREVPGEPIGIPATDNPEFVESLRGFTQLPDSITASELVELQKNLNRALRKRSGSQMAQNELRIITEMKSASFDDLSKIQLPGDEGALVQGQVRKAKQAWADFKSLEETAAAGRFKRVDKNFFGAGFEKQGPAEMDELADIFVSAPSTLRSPEFIDGLEQLVGPQNRRRLARAVLERAANARPGLARATFDPGTGVGGGTSDIVVFDAARMRQQLGLVAPEELGPGVAKRNKAALNRLLKGSGVNAESLDAFLNVVERNQASLGADPSAFLQRRIILGGGLGAGALGAGKATEKFGTIGLGVFLLGARQFSDLISSPRGLRILREGLNPNITRQQKLNLARRLAAFFPNEQPEIEGESIEPFPEPPNGAFTGA
jgi:hypothetical protein